MGKKLFLFALFCALTLVSLIQMPSVALSRSTINPLALNDRGHDFSMPQQQTIPPAPTATPTSPTSPLPTPTNTPVPAPTNMPPTGADLLTLAENANPWNDVNLLSDAFAASEQGTDEQAQPGYLANGSLLYPVRLAATAIDLDTLVKPLGWRQVTEANQETSIWHMVDKNAGWHLNSVVPGQVGNAVMSGHNNIGGSVFRNLHRLQPKDEITVWTNEGVSIAYTVETVNIVPEKYATAAQRAANAQAISSTTDTRLTLVTCWPASSNTHRVIVVARPVE
jgi:LPXTG-site transpeptidase (sortase) family protein